MDFNLDAYVKDKGRIKAVPTHNLSKKFSPLWQSCKDGQFQVELGMIHKNKVHF